MHALPIRVIDISDQTTHQPRFLSRFVLSYDRHACRPMCRWLIVLLECLPYEMIQHDAGGGRRERERGRASCAVSKQRYFPEMFPATSSRHVTMHRSRKFLARRMSRIPLSFIFIFILHATHAYTCTHTHTHTLRFWIPYISSHSAH